MLLHYAILLVFISAMIMQNFLIQKQLANSYLTKSNKSSVFSKYFLLFSIFSLCLLVAFRHPNIGNDTMNYKISYDNILSLDDAVNSHFEIGYSILVFLFKKLNFEFQVFLFFTALVSFYGVYKFILSTSNDYVFSSLLFYLLFFSFFLSGIRQSIALSISLLAYLELKDNRFIRFFIFTILAITFHYSALVLFIFPFVLKRKTNHLLGFFAVIITSIAAFINLVPSIVQEIFPRYMLYFESEYSGGIRLAIVYELLRTVVVLILLGFVSNKRLRLSDPLKGCTANTYYWIMVTSLCFLILSLDMNLIRRSGSYFIIFTVVIVPFISSLIKNERYRFLFKTAFISISILYFTLVLIYRPEWNSIYPYRFFWTE